MAEVERRASAYGLPPVRWPANWPNNGLAAMRAAWVAKRDGREREFALAGFRMAFTEGIDLSEPEAVRELAERFGIEEAGIASPAVKDALREASDDAVERGVIGVPTLLFGGEPVWGDDRLDEALAAAGLALTG
jgi:2-hydroxychromene-2-carboxylate isomerase